MGKVVATTREVILVSPATALAALKDYSQTRPKILPEQYQNYAVVDGGNGAGTVITYTLAATEKRSRNVTATVTVGADAAGTDTITETDANSSLVTQFSAIGADKMCTVEVTTTWDGAGGIGGIFEKIFAPKGLGRIQAATLANLKTLLESS